MKLSALQNRINFSSSSSGQVSVNCGSKPCFMANSLSHDAILIENQVLKVALRNACRIIAQDEFVRKTSVDSK